MMLRVSVASSRPEPEPTRHLLDEPLRRCLSTLVDSVGAYEALRDGSGRIIDFTIVYTNDEGAAGLGVHADDYVGHRLCEVFPEVRSRGYFDKYCQVVETGVALVEPALERNGRWCELRVSRLGDGFIAVWRDITDRKRVESELRRSNAMLAAVVDTSAAAIFVKDLTGRYLLANPVAQRYLTQSAVGRTDFDLFPAHVAAELLQKDRIVFATGQAVTSEEHIEANGERHTFFTVKTPLRDDNGVIYALCGVATDITSRIRTEEALRARAEELAVLIDATPAAVWIALDSGCREIRGSREAHTLLRMPPSANLSTTPGDGSPPTHFRVFEKGTELSPEQMPVQRAARGEELRNFEEEVVFDNGDRVCLYGNAMPLMTADGSPRGAISVFVDITAHKRVEEDLRRAQAAAEAASHAKDEFLATVSHELRTPLNAVLGYVSMLQQGVIPPERVPAVLATVSRNARAQLQVIDDILDVSGIRHGKLTLVLEPLNVAAVVLDAIQTVSPTAAGKRIEITHALAGLDVSVVGDERRLHQVFWNLLVNAVKFTPGGGHVTVVIHEEETHVEITIADSGIGIAPEFLPRIFDRFTQESIGSTRAQGGLGLGLSIVHHVVMAHGGTMSVSSDGRGQGAAFRIRLPRTPA